MLLQGCVNAGRRSRPRRRQAPIRAGAPTTPCTCGYHHRPRVRDRRGLPDPHRAGLL